MRIYTEPELLPLKIVAVILLSTPVIQWYNNTDISKVSFDLLQSKREDPQIKKKNNPFMSIKDIYTIKQITSM